MKLNAAIISAAVAVLIQPAWGQGYAEHRGVTRFTEQPCGDVLAALSPDAIPDADGIKVDKIGAFAKEMGHAMATQGVAWGFILGYDTAHGGLGRDGFTTLERFRAACRKSPEATGIDILEGLKG